jgi:hypothetical protein
MRDESRDADPILGTILMRHMLLGGVIAVAVCGVATARPPESPLSEGREVDPVAREFYHGDPPTPPSEKAEPSQAAKPGDTCAWPLRATFAALESLLRGIALPLGPLVVNNM